VGNQDGRNKTPGASVERVEAERELEPARMRQALQEKERIKKVKKDILAAITFLMTGLIFYVVQTDSKVDELLSSGIECEAAGTVVVGENTSKAEMDLTFQDEGTRDS